MSFKSFVSRLLAGLILIQSWECNKRLPFEPVVTNDMDWIPSTQLAQNGYQRIELAISRPPRKELLRNIVQYNIQIWTSPDGQLVDAGTIPGAQIPPAYLIPSPEYPWMFDSRPVLKDDASYFMVLGILYRDGATRYSSEISFRTPSQRGKILRDLPLPPDVPPWAEAFIAFHGSSILLLYGSTLYSIDTVGGASRILKSNFRVTQWGWQTFEDLAVTGDTLVTFFKDFTGLQATIVLMNLTTSQVDSSIKVTLPLKYIVGIACKGSLLYTLWDGNIRPQLMIINLLNGQIIETTPEAHTMLSYPPGLVCDGRSLWLSSINAFDNRLLRTDASTLNVLESRRNPVFSPHDIAWDGSSFWVFDSERGVISRIQPGDP